MDCLELASRAYRLLRWIQIDKIRLMRHQQGLTCETNMSHLKVVLVLLEKWAGFQQGIPVRLRVAINNFLAYLIASCKLFLYMKRPSSFDNQSLRQFLQHCFASLAEDDLNCGTT